MAKTRVWELARRYGITSSEALGKLGAIGVDASLASSSLQPRMVEKFDRTYGSELRGVWGLGDVRSTSSPDSAKQDSPAGPAGLREQPKKPHAIPGGTLAQQEIDEGSQQASNNDRRVRLLLSLLRVTGVTDDAETVLRELDRADPLDDAAVLLRWVEGDGAPWLRRPSGSAELWLDV